MANHSSAPVRETPHVNALRQRAQSVINDRSIDPQSRAIIRYALETNDPWLAELVRRTAAGEAVIEARIIRTQRMNPEKRFLEFRHYL